MQRLVHFKRTPCVDRRYWVALILASMCGTNLGDTIPDILHLSPAFGVAVFAALFVILLVIDRLYPKGHEAFYWTAILCVRASATNVADYSIHELHLNYVATFLVSIALFILLSTFRMSSRSEKLASGTAVAEGAFWLTMLVAAISGTVLADGIGHAFSSVEVGVPVSAALATAYLIAAFVIRSRNASQLGVSYWAVVFGTLWSGTNVGDILAFVSKLPVSLAVTAGLLIADLTLRLGDKNDEASGAARLQM